MIQLNFSKIEFFFHITQLTIPDAWFLSYFLTKLIKNLTFTIQKSRKISNQDIGFSHTIQNIIVKRKSKTKKIKTFNNPSSTNTIQLNVKQLSKTHHKNHHKKIKNQNFKKIIIKMRDQRKKSYPSIIWVIIISRRLSVDQKMVRSDEIKPLTAMIMIRRI